MDVNSTNAGLADIGSACNAEGSEKDTQDSPSS